MTDQPIGFRNDFPPSYDQAIGGHNATAPVDHEGQFKNVNANVVQTGYVPFSQQPMASEIPVRSAGPAYVEQQSIHYVVPVEPGAAPFEAVLLFGTFVRYQCFYVNNSCTKCGHRGATRVNKISGTMAWLCCIGLCLIGCDLGCCLFPFCMDSCQDVEHRCGRCGAFICRSKAL